MPRRRPCSGRTPWRCSWNARAPSSTGFAVDAANAAAILSVCTHVDGIPLALELAAVRLNALGLDGLERGLAARLGALGTGDRSASLRQQTLEGAIDWSYQLLREPERRLWERLSVFAGGFELDAARSVCAGDGLDDADIPDLVGIPGRQVGHQATTGTTAAVAAARAAPPVRPRTAPGGGRRTPAAIASRRLGR